MSAVQVERLKPQRSRWLSTRKNLVILTIVSVMILTEVLMGSFYMMSYNSVNGTTVQLMSATRVDQGGNVTSFTLQVHVWSFMTSIGTHLSHPSFTLTVDDLPFATVIAPDGTWQRNGYAPYTLKFETTNSSIAGWVGRYSASYLDLTMDGVVSAGGYSLQLSRSDAQTLTFG